MMRIYDMTEPGQRLSGVIARVILALGEGDGPEKQATTDLVRGLLGVGPWDPMPQQVPDRDFAPGSGRN